MLEKQKMSTRKQGMVDAINRVGLLVVFIAIVFLLVYFKAKGSLTKIWQKLNVIESKIEEFCNGT